MKKNFLFVAVSMSFFLVMAALVGMPQRNMESSLSLTAPAASPAIGVDRVRLPLHFIPNEGQVDGPPAFYVQGRDKTIYFADEGLTFVLNGPREKGSERSTETPSERWVVKLDFVGANPEAVPVSLEDSGAVVSYFKGKPENWKAGLAASSRIVYRELWPGIDLHYYGTVDRMKYEFIVQPGADPSRIKLAYRGAESVTLTEAGRLAVATPVGGFEDDVPVAWQEIEGSHTDIAAAYVLEAGEAGAGKQVYVYGFEVGAYDRSLPLVLDPAVLVYCGYIGGSVQDSGYGIAVDSSGNAYVTGRTQSTESTFPLMDGPDLTHNGDWDAFIAKVNAAGTALIYCGYIGGSEYDGGYGIAVDGSGNAYITGCTYSTEATFPVTIGPDLTYNGWSDAFVAKVNAAGTALVYCGYIGGSLGDVGYGIAVDGSGNAYVTGGTSSSGVSFPVVVGPDLHQNGFEDAFVAKVNADGSALVYCGYIGGEDYDCGLGIAVDASGNAYVTGATRSMPWSFPRLVGPRLTYGGGRDAFVAKVNADGSALVYCGYIGGSGSDWGYGIAVDGSGNAYVTGETSSSAATFPVAVGPRLIHNGIWDAFVAKVNSAGTDFVYCGYIGGSGSDRGEGIAVDGQGNAYITGSTFSGDFPVVVGPGLSYNGERDGFVAKVNAAGTDLVYGGYIGGSGEDWSLGIAVDGWGNAYVTGQTRSAEDTFPVVVGPGLTYSGDDDYDAFVAKISAYDIPGPAIASLLPSGAAAGGGSFTMSVIGTDFVNGAIVLWDRANRPTTFVSEYEVMVEIGAADLETGKIVEVAVMNPDGGLSNALEFAVAAFTLGASPSSLTVAAGQSATYTIQVAPQFDSFDSSITFSVSGLPRRCAASFLPATVTPGFYSVSTVLTVTTTARTAASVTGAAIGSAGPIPTAVALLFLVSAFTLLSGFGKSGRTRLSGHRLAAAGALLCLAVLIGGCSLGGGGGDKPGQGTPSGTYQITVRGTAGSLIVQTTVTLVVQ